MAEGKDFFGLGGEAEVGVDDGEGGAVSVSSGRRRGERTWMPEKAAGCE